MDTDLFSRPLKSILVFGATGHIGRPLAEYITNNSPSTQLRLATSAPNKVNELKQRFPNADIVLCSYYDQEQLNNAFQDMEGVYMITPDFTDETTATNNLVNAAKSHQVRHIVRLMGDPPGMTLDRVPEYLRQFGGGASAAVGHTIARDILNRSQLPVTYTSIAGYYMDDLCGVWHGRGIKRGNVLVDVKCHHMPYIDPAEAGEAAARILLRRDPADIGKDYLLNNGIDLWDFHDVAKMLSKELGKPIAYQEGEAAYRRWIGPSLEDAMGDGATDFFIAYFTWEDSVLADIAKQQIGGLAGEIARLIQLKAPRWLKEFLIRPLWNKKDKNIYHADLENILGRRPKSLTQWIQENRSLFMA